MHIGYGVYFHEKGIGEMKWGIITRFGLGRESEVKSLVEKLKNGDITYVDNEHGAIDREKYDFGYMEMRW